MLELIETKSTTKKPHLKMTIDLTGGDSKKLDEDTAGEENQVAVCIYERKSSLSLKCLFHFMNICIIIFIIIYLVIILTMRGK